MKLSHEEYYEELLIKLDNIDKTKREIHKINMGNYTVVAIPNLKCPHKKKCEWESGYCNNHWYWDEKGDCHVYADYAPFTRAAAALRNGLVFKRGFKIFLEDKTGIFQTITVSDR